MSTFVIRAENCNILFMGEKNPSRRLYVLQMVNLDTMEITNLQMRSGADGEFALQFPMNDSKYYVDSSSFAYGLPYQITCDVSRRNHVINEFGVMLGDMFLGDLSESQNPIYSNIIYNNDQYNQINNIL